MFGFVCWCVSVIASIAVILSSLFSVAGQPSFAASLPPTSLSSTETCSPQDPQLDRCSLHGLFLFDVNECECFQCFEGEWCEKSIANCTVDVSVADGYIFEDYFVKNWNSPNLVVTLPTWYRMTYQRPMVMPTSLNNLITKTIFDLHKSVGNADVGSGLRLVLPSTHVSEPKGTRQHAGAGNEENGNVDAVSLMIGTGSTMVLRALIATMAKMEGKQMNLVARAPYYPMFKFWAQENPIWTAWSNRTDLDPSTVIEIVTYPNNPDGKKCPPMYPDAKYIIHDMVYYWPHLTTVDKLMDADIMVFSSSKLTGHGASRFGWALVKNAALAAASTGFTQIEEISSSIDGIYRQMRVLRYIHSEESSFFSYSKAVLESRWKELQDLFHKQSQPAQFALESEPNTWFAWVNCLSLPKGTSCQSLFSTFGIIGEFGDGEMGIDHHIRLSLNQHDTTWPILVNRIISLLQI
eukprot:m.16832 g.16832  ORF g.16832 m.16832 type:complete len:464 (+) comp8057_c0_seq1:72-1463(+)